MKRILLFLMLILTLNFCSPPTDKIVGVWSYTNLGNVTFKYTFESNKHYKYEMDLGAGLIEFENGNYSFDDETNRLTLNFEQKRPDSISELENAPEGSFKTITIGIDSTKMSLYGAYISGNPTTIEGEWKHYNRFSNDGITTFLEEETINLKADGNVDYTNIETIGTGQPTTETATATWLLDTENSIITISNSSNTNLLGDGNYYYTIIDGTLMMSIYVIDIYEKE